MSSSERRGKRAERDERREKGRPLGERREKRREKRQQRETSTIKIRWPKKAIVRSQNGEAQGRVDWKRDGLPDAKFEVTAAKWDLGKEQQREKREKRREKREERWFGPRRAGW